MALSCACHRMLDRIRERWRCFGLALLVALRTTGTATAEEDIISGVDGNRYPVRRVARPDADEEGLVLPNSQILRDTEPPYENLFRDVRVGGRVYEKAGPTDLSVHANLLAGPRINVPLAMPGVRPYDAELKLGRFYFDVHSASASLLYSDNVRLAEDNREDGLIGIVRLRVAAWYQATDNMRLGVQGTFVYLPFHNEVGVAGFGIDDPLIEFETMPLFQAQVTFDRQVGGWDVEIIDDLRLRYRRFGAGFDWFDGETFDEEDRAGRYVYRTRPPTVPGGGNVNRINRPSESFIEGRNLAGAAVSRLLPTVTRLEFGGYHADYWYYGTDDDRLPRSRDSVYALLSSERETMRFKPYARYRAFRNNDADGWGQDARVGVRGPVTENLSLMAEGGYYWRTDSDRQSYVGRVRLRHTFNPLTYHQLAYYRGLTEPIEELTDMVSYQIRHVFRDNLSGQFYGSLARYESARTSGRSGEERRAGLRFTYDPAQHLTLRLTGGYADFRNEDSPFDDYEEWIGRSEIFYRHSASLESRLLYQYRNRHGERPGDSYWENLAVLSVIKYF